MLSKVFDVIDAAVGVGAIFSLERTNPAPGFLKFPHTEHHLREFGLGVNILLDLRVVHEIIWPFSGKTIRYPQLYPKEWKFCWKCRKFPFLQGIQLFSLLLHLSIQSFSFFREAVVHCAFGEQTLLVEPNVGSEGECEQRETWENGKNKN